MKVEGSRTIIIADREPLYLSAMRAALDEMPSHQIMADIFDCQQLLQHCSDVRPHLVVTGFVLACNRTALGIVPKMREVSPDTSLLVILPIGGGSFAHRLASQGVTGLISRQATSEILRQAVEIVSRGGAFYDSSIDHCHPHPNSIAGEIHVHNLSCRELEIFRLLGSEQTYKEIATLLGISSRTIEVHRENIKTKLGIRSAHSLSLAARVYIFWEATGIDRVI